MRLNQSFLCRQKHSRCCYSPTMRATGKVDKRVRFQRLAHIYSMKVLELKLQNHADENQRTPENASR